MKKKLLLLYLSLVTLSAQVLAQQKTVTGKVTDASDGRSLAGVTIVVKSTSRTAQTNPQGMYSIQAAQSETLLFRYVGMEAKEEKVGASATLNVAMSAVDESLDEVVVTAYGVDRQKKSLGYSVQTVSGDDVSQTQRSSFFSGLQGRVAGLSVNPTSGNPGASSQIVLRGFVSISGDNSALIVVDGVPIDNSTLNQTNDLVTGDANRDQDYSNRGMDINPEDIESYTILKGPEATALYGSRGSSGAIVITTKKSNVKDGKGTISYNDAFSFSQYTRLPSFQTKYMNGTNGVFDAASYLTLGPAYADTAKIYDNVSDFFETAFTQKHNLVFEGGTEKYSYRWSNEYTDDKGAIPTTQLRRVTSRLNATATLSPLLKLTTSFAYIDTYNRKVNKGNTGVLLDLARYPANWDVNDWQDEYGNRKTHVGSIYAELDNPLWDINKNLNEDKGRRMMANTNISLTPTKWLFIDGVFGADIGTTNGLRVYHAQSYLGSGSATTPTGGELTIYDRMAKLYNASLTARAVHNFGDFNNTYILGATLSDNNITTNSSYGQNMYDPNFYSINNTLASTQRTRTAVSRYRNVGAFAQAILGYKSLLYLTLSGRVDGASRLMPNNPYFFYPSASMAFNFSELQGFKDNFSWIDAGKLRFSWGKTGKEPWRDYSTLSTLGGSNATGGGFAYGYYGGNPDLKQETSENIETGAEFQFLQNRLSLDFDVYRLRSINQIINPRISYGSGFVLKMMNGGTVENKGLEFTLKGNPFRSKDFRWDITMNYAMNRGKVLSLPEGLPELYDSDTWQNNVRSAVFPGASTGELSGLKLDHNDAGQILINPDTGVPYTTDIKYYPIGDRTPKFTTGLVNNFQYKAWSLSFLWDLKVGGDVFNASEFINYSRGNSSKTLDREEPRVIEGVLKDGLENTDHPTVNTISVIPYYNYLYYTTYVQADMFLEHDINVLRLRDITLSYTLPESLSSRLKYFHNIGVYATVTDLLLFTNYSGIDPESNSNTAALGGMGGYGIDLGNMGRPITVNFGIRFKL